MNYEQKYKEALKAMKNLYDVIAWLEEQRQEKSIDMSIKEKAHQIAWETSKHYDPLLSKESWCEMAALDMASWLEKRGEQKPTDNVEPKFKAGDWIIGNTNNIYTVICVIDDEYRLLYNIDDSIVCAKIKTIDKKFHLWTIQDAKDGDVLASSDWVCIFKRVKPHHYNLFDSYCELLSCKDFGLGFDFNIHGFYPATENQRDLLFQKMKEAGYEWDADKKELKKIEQKQDWSEEDEKMFDEVCSSIKYAEKHRITCPEKLAELQLDWLKSIKKRLVTNC